MIGGWLEASNGSFDSSNGNITGFAMQRGAGKQKRNVDPHIGENLFRITEKSVSSF